MPCIVHCVVVGIPFVFRLLMNVYENHIIKYFPFMHIYTTNIFICFFFCFFFNFLCRRTRRYTSRRNRTNQSSISNTHKHAHTACEIKRKNIIDNYIVYRAFKGRTTGGGANIANYQRILDVFIFSVPLNTNQKIIIN